MNQSTPDIIIKGTILNPESDKMLWCLVSVSSEVFNTFVTQNDISPIKTGILKDDILGSLLDENAITVTVEAQTSLVARDLLSQYKTAHQQELANVLNNEQLIVVKVSLEENREESKPEEPQKQLFTGLTVTRGGE